MRPGWSAVWLSAGVSFVPPREIYVRQRKFSENKLHQCTPSAATHFIANVCLSMRCLGNTALSKATMGTTCVFSRCRLSLKDESCPPVAPLGCCQPSVNMSGPCINNNGSGSGGYWKVPHGPSAVASTGGADYKHTSSTEDAAAGEVVAAAVPSSTAGTATPAAGASTASVASVPVESPQGIKKFKIGDKVEYRWGAEAKWYRCEVTKVGGEGKSDEVELEFLSRKKRKTKAGRIYSDILKVADLEADGDIAAPGTHLDF